MYRTQQVEGKIDYSINTIQNIINMRVNDSFKTEANLLYFAINSAKHANWKPWSAAFNLETEQE